MKFISIGGNDEVGKNFYILEIQNRIIILDCGIQYPSKNFFGIDAIIADYSYLVNNKNRIAAIILSHGHKDNSGSFPFIIDKFPNVKVYLSRPTHKIITYLIDASKRWKIKKIPINYIYVEDNNTYNITNDISLVAFEVPHSLPGTFSYLIKTSEGNILYLTDYIITGNKIWNKEIMPITQRIANEKVDVLLNDSSHTSEPGFSSPEYSISKYLRNVLYHYEYKKRYIIAMYNSDIFYMKEIIDIAIKHNLSVYVYSKDMYDFIKLSSKLNYFNLQNVRLVYIAKNVVPKDGIVVISSDKELLFSDIYNIALDSNPSIILNKDTDLFLSIAQIIPGNELLVVKSLNEITKSRVDIASIPLKFVKSMHPFSEDLMLILSTVKPKFFIPIKGLFSDLSQSAIIGEKFVDKKNIFVIDNGKILDINIKNNTAKIMPHRLQLKDIFIDGIGIGDVSHMVLNERRMLGTNGAIIIAFNCSSKNISSSISISLIGVVSSNEVENIKTQIAEIINKDIKNFDAAKLPELKNQIKKNVEKFMWKSFKKDSIVLPIIIKK